MMRSTLPGRRPGGPALLGIDPGTSPVKATVTDLRRPHFLPHLHGKRTPHTRFVQSVRESGDRL